MKIMVIYFIYILLISLPKKNPITQLKLDYIFAWNLIFGIFRASSAL